MSSAPFHHFTYVTTHSPTFPSLYLCHTSFSNLSITSPTPQLIIQPFRRFTYVTAHSPTLPLLHLRHNSFSYPSFASTSQALHLIYLASHQNSFSNLSVTSPTSQLILQPFRRLTYVTAHSPTLPLLHLRRSSFSNPSFASPVSQALHLIHLAAYSPTFPSLHLRHNTFSNLPSLFLNHSSFSDPSVASPTSQLILQPLFRFSYVTDTQISMACI